MNEYYDQVIEFDNLYNGLKKSCRNIRWKDSVVNYEANAILNTYKLQQQLKDGSYKISPYQRFKIYEPKERDIIASRLVDRQFQRSLCDNGLYKDITEHFIYDNVACQINKGTDYALKRLKVHLRKFYNKFGVNGYVLKCDIHHFFPSTSHEIAKQVINKYVSDERAALAVNNIIDSYEGDYGIGLGSQVSQLIELLFLTDLDHYIKEQLHIKYYIRYMDDFILIHNDKQYLKFCLEKIRDFLTERELELNKRTQINSISNGIKFLQWNFKLTPTGKILMLPNRQKVIKEKNKLKKLYKKVQNGELPEKVLYESFNSWMSNIKRGDSYQIQKEMHQFFYQLIGGRANESQKVSREQIN